MEHFEAKSSVNEAFQSISKTNIIQKLKRRPWRRNHIILIQSMNRNNSPKLWMSYQTYRRCSGISVRMWFIHFWMTTKHKSPTSRSSTHPRLSEVNGADRAIAGSKHNSLYHFWQRFTISHKTLEYKRVVWIITLTHIRSACETTKICMCLYQTRKCKQSIT